MAALTTPLAPSGVDGARSMSFRSISTRVPVAGARVLPRKANVAVRAEGSSIREQAGRRGTYLIQHPVPTTRPRLQEHKTLSLKTCHVRFRLDFTTQNNKLTPSP